MEYNIIPFALYPTSYVPTGIYFDHTKTLPTHNEHNNDKNNIDISKIYDFLSELFEKSN